MFLEQTTTIKLTKSMAAQLKEFASNKAKEISIHADELRKENAKIVAGDFDHLAMNWYELQQQLEDVLDNFL